MTNIKAKKKENAEESHGIKSKKDFPPQDYGREQARREAGNTNFA